MGENYNSKNCFKIWKKKIFFYVTYKTLSHWFPIIYDRPSSCVVLHIVRLVKNVKNSHFFNSLKLIINNECCWWLLNVVWCNFWLKLTNIVNVITLAQGGPDEQGKNSQQLTISQNIFLCFCTSEIKLNSQYIPENPL